MRVLSAIVQVAALPVLDIGQKFALRHAVAPRFVGDENAGTASAASILAKLDGLPASFG
jgi:hypothetical protein